MADHAVKANARSSKVRARGRASSWPPSLELEPPRLTSSLSPLLPQAYTKEAKVGEGTYATVYRGTQSCSPALLRSG